MKKRPTPTTQDWKEYYAWRDRQRHINLTIYQWLEKGKPPYQP